MSVKDKKSEIRLKYKKLRQSLSAAEKAELDRRITENFLSMDCYKNCETLLAFISKDIEVDTAEIIQQAFKDGKTVAAPKCNLQNNTMDFYIIKSFDELENGFFGIMEPKSSCKKVLDFKSSLCIVPGLAFDKAGFRVGFGKGFYDRFLNGYNGKSAGVCYSFCIEDELPCNEFDRCADIVITDKTNYRKGNGNG